MVDHSNIYRAGSLGYIYPPLLAVLLSVLVPLGEQGAATLWLGFNILCAAATIGISARDAYARLATLRPTLSEPVLRTVVVLGAALGFILIADKVRADCAMGQCNLLIACCWILSLRLLDRAPLLSGSLLGFIANIKYISLIAVPYLILRKRYTAAVCTLMFTLLFALTPAMRLGWSQNLTYLGGAFGGLTRMSTQQGEVTEARPDAGSSSDGRARIAGLSDIRSISIPSFAGRMTDRPLTNPGTLVIIVVPLAAFCGLAWHFYRRRGIPLVMRQDHGADSLLVATEWSGLFVGMLAFGPQSNPRHLVMLLPMLILATSFILRGVVVQARVMPLILGCLALFLALILPPGGETFESWVHGWRWVSGISFCLLFCYLTLLSTILRVTPREPSRATRS